MGSISGSETRCGDSPLNPQPPWIFSGFLNLGLDANELTYKDTGWTVFETPSTPPPDFLI